MLETTTTRYLKITYPSYHIISPFPIFLLKIAAFAFTPAPRNHGNIPKKKDGAAPGTSTKESAKRMNSALALRSSGVAMAMKVMICSEPNLRWRRRHPWWVMVINGDSWAERLRLWPKWRNGTQHSRFFSWGIPGNGYTSKMSTSQRRMIDMTGGPGGYNLHELHASGEWIYTWVIR